MKQLSLLMATLLCLQAMSQTAYYVSPTGDDVLNNGSMEQPYQTITKALTVFATGDTIYLRGGSHMYTDVAASSIISIGNSGKADSINCLLAYPGEHPILDRNS